MEALKTGGGHFDADIDEPTRRGLRGCSMRLGRQLRAKLARSLARPPADAGYRQSLWSGALLARHLLQTYGLSLTTRHCRRLLAELAPKAKAPARPIQSATVTTRTSMRTTPWSETHRKQVALKRIKRLASAGLPLRTFALALMDLVADAIPQTDLRIMTADFANHLWLSGEDLSPLAPLFGHLLTIPEENGLVLDPQILVRQQTWSHEEIEIGRNEDSISYNELGRHIGYHHVLALMIHDDRGGLGCFPLWRSAKMAPFSRTDRQFLDAIAPQVNHAVSIARHFNPDKASAEGDFEKMAGFPSGIAMVDANGRIVALNDAARSIFFHFGRNQYALPLNAFADDQIATP